MRGCTLLLSALAYQAIGSFALADNSGDTTRGEKLAWHIEAYVPCDGTGKINALKAEVASFEATREEVVAALDYILVDDNACAPLKKSSADFLELAEAQPGKFDATFGFIVESDVVGSADVASKVNSKAPRTAEGMALPPPKASSIKVRSSY